MRAGRGPGWVGGAIAGFGVDRRGQARLEKAVTSLLSPKALAAGMPGGIGALRTGGSIDHRCQEEGVFYFGSVGLEEGGELLGPLADGAGGVAQGHVVAGAVDGGFVFFAVGELHDDGFGGAFAETALDGDAASGEKPDSHAGDGAERVFHHGFGDVSFGAGGVQLDEVHFQDEGIFAGLEGEFVRGSWGSGEGAGEFPAEAGGDFLGLLRAQPGVFGLRQFFGNGAQLIGFDRGDVDELAVVRDAQQS
ncbi:MAG: hypothetical protein JWL81_638, partial [Verrucomicrobiales bacterium]|nr:hypothetical protein [Verrucomicrobiales bacterium]